MTAIHANEFLLAQFRDFYTEVIRLKQLIKSSGGMSSVDALPAETVASGNGHGAMIEPLSGGKPITSLAVRDAFDSTREPSTEQTKLTLLVWQNLIALFRRNAVQVLRAAGKPTDNYFEAQYVMAAFADDVFIHLDWEGRRAWMSNLLESTLFQSHVAGEVFFEKLDRLLRDRDPADKSLATVYLTALSLGFRGMYHGLNDHGKLRNYRQELFNFIFRQPADLINDAKVAFPDSYVQNLRKEKRKKLLNPRVWLAVLGFVLIGYLGLSHGVWVRLTARLERANQQIVEMEKRLDSLAPAK